MVMLSCLDARRARRRRCAARTAAAASGWRAGGVRQPDDGMAHPGCRAGHRRCREDLRDARLRPDMARADCRIASRIPAAPGQLHDTGVHQASRRDTGRLRQRHQVNRGVLSGRNGGPTWRLVSRVPARNPAFAAVAPSPAATGSGQLWAMSDNGAKLADVTGDGASGDHLPDLAARAGSLSHALHDLAACGAVAIRRFR